MQVEEVNFVGMKIHAITRDNAIKKVKEFVDSERYHYQISLNVAKLVSASKDAKLRTIVNNAAIINADGYPIYLAVKMLSKTATSRMGGIDYIYGLAENYPELKYYLFGAEDQVVKDASHILKQKYGMNIIGVRNGYFSKDEFPEILNEINSLKPDILFIAIGTPAKEYFLYDLKDKLDVKFAIGVGGAFDIIVGKIRRAPKFLQNIGCEWLFRLVQEPRRLFKRYAITNTVFLLLLLREALEKIKTR
jgi:N-acetylglucosaminyldiphosphoundecaprenol N-acetyl-beta-D-mannosaminyltransferase